MNPDELLRLTLNTTVTDFRKRRRSASVHHLRPTFPEHAEPIPCIKLEPPHSVDVLLSSSNADVFVVSADAWVGLSSTLKQKARENPLYHVVIAGGRQPQRRSAQAAIRRFEVILQWAEQKQQEGLEHVVKACIERGIARNKSRPISTHVSKVASFPKLPDNISDIVSSYGFTVNEALTMGSTQTTRVIDELGKQAWMVPMKTYLALTTALYSDDDKPVPPPIVAPSFDVLDTSWLT